MKQTARQDPGRGARYKRIKTWRRVVSILCVIVVFCTTYALVLPAITLEKTPCCGMQEHVHTDECFAEQQTLVCPLEQTEGHVHTDACYAEQQTLVCPLEENEDHVHGPECYETERTLICPLAECEPHVHTDECYETERVLVCTIPEHAHTDACFEAEAAEAEPDEKAETGGDPNADVEGEADWNAMIARIPRTGSVREDVVAIAASQLGYAESGKNYVIDPDTGARMGYTRYGAWYGMPYQSWCAMFAAFCLHYAGVTEAQLPRSAACDRWAELLAARGLSAAPFDGEEAYAPRPGDLIFFRNAPDAASPDHVGIVEYCDAQTRTVHTIEGNCSDSVSRMRYALDDPRIVLYCPMPEQEDGAGTSPAEEPEPADGEAPETIGTMQSAAPTRTMSAPLRGAFRGSGSVNDLITAAVITVDGQQISGADWGALVKGKTYRLTLTFRENRSHQFAADDDWMEYDLPPELSVMNVSGKFDQNLGYFGTLKNNDFEISGGKLRFRWNTADTEKFEILRAADSATVAFNMDIWFDGEVRTIRFGAGLDKTVDLNDPHDAGVQKSGYYDPNDQKIHYRVEISSRGASENVRLTDSITGSALTYDEGSLTVKNKNGQSIPSGQWGAWSYSPGGFTLELPDMNDGDRYVVEYTASVHLDRLGHSGQTTYSETGNTARISSRTDDDPGNNTSTNYLYNIQSSDLSKRAGAPGDVYSENGQKYRDITWSIHANAQKLTNVGTITDRIDANSRSRMDFTGTGLRIRVTRPNGTVENRNVAWNTNGLQLSPDGKSWSYTPPASDGNAEYEIGYTTRVRVEGGTVEVTNTVSDAHNTTVEGQFVPGEGGSGGDEPEDRLEIYKTATAVNDEYVVWTIRIPVPREGFDSFTVTEELPYLAAVSTSDPIDRTYGSNGFLIEGLADGESWSNTEAFQSCWINEPDGSTEVTDDVWKCKTTETLTFYKDPGKTQPGLRTAGQNRELVIRIRTKNNSEWMDFALEDGNEYAKTHQNQVRVDADGKRGSTAASATPLKARITKSTETDPPLKPQTVKLKDGKEYTAYPYQITVEGVQKEPVEIFDFFDTDLFEVLEISDLAADYNNSNAQMINTPALNPQRITPCEGPWGGQPSDVFATVTDREGGVLFTMTDLPKKVDSRTGEQTVYYGFYRMTCYLVLKDEEALKRQAMLSGGTTTFRNTAEYKNSTSEADVEYTYKVVSKEAQDGTDSAGEPTNRVQHFTIRINPDRLRLNGGNPMELTDTSSPSLAICYDTVQITTDPPSRRDEITYDFDDRTGVFTVPDETGIVIEYDANVLGEGLVQFRNDATLDGKYTDYADDTIQMSAGGGGSAEVVAIRLMKYAAGHMEQGTLAGARFRLLDADRQPVLTTDQGQQPPGQQIVFETTADGPEWIMLSQYEDGMTLRKNTPYFLEEIEAPPGYERSHSLIPFVVSDDTDYQAPDGFARYYVGGIMNIRNEPETDHMGLTIVKRFAGNETLTDEQKGRIGFRITGPEGFERTVGYGEFDEDGAYTLGALEPGEYTVCETGAVLAAAGTGYSVVTTCAVDEGEAYTVTDYLNEGAQVVLTENETSTVVFTNTYCTHSYDFTKVDSRTDQPLEGAVFTVCRAEDAQPVAVYTSAADGRFRVKWSDQSRSGAPLYQQGVLYEICETQPPEGYFLPPEPTKYYFCFGQPPSGAPEGTVDLSSQDGEATVANSSDAYLTVVKRWVNSLGEPTGNAPEGVDSLRFRIYRTERIVAHEQSPGDWEVTREPTCTEPGARARYCTLCGELLETETIPALGHDWGPWAVVTEPTTTETGLKQRVCARCGAAETEVVPVHVHTAGDWVTTWEPACTEPGARARYCTGCGVVMDSEALPALGHDYADAVTAPTCTQNGYTTHTCARCGDTYADSPVPALGHDFVNGICTRCGAEDPDNPPVTTATATLKIRDPWSAELSKQQQIPVGMPLRFVCVGKSYQENYITSLTVNGQAVSFTKEKKQEGEVWYYISTSEPFTAAGDVTVAARLSNVPSQIKSYELVAADSAGGQRSAARKAARLSARPAAEAADSQAPPAQAERGAQADVPVDMTPEALQAFLTESGAVPFGEEFTVTGADGWKKTIPDLPRRQGYIEYTYYVVELDAEGYGYRLAGYDGEGTDQITAVNQTRPTSFVLPQTGGTGTARHKIAGLALLLASLVIAYTKLRRRRPRGERGGPDG